MLPEGGEYSKYDALESGHESDVDNYNSEEFNEVIFSVLESFHDDDALIEVLLTQRLKRTCWSDMGSSRKHERSL